MISKTKKITIKRKKNNIQKGDFISITTFSKEKPKNFECDITLLIL